MGPGSDLGSPGSFAITWLTMMAAMMWPSALPALLSYDRSARARHDVTGPAPSSFAFALAYLVVWLAFGLGAFIVFRGVRAAHLGFLAWDRAGPYLVAAAIIAAGLYELTPLKRRALSRCRTVATSADHGWWSGLGNGVDCVACCAGLMTVLLVLGPMSSVWMVVVATAVIGQKVPAFGPRLVRPVAIGLIALGVWVAIAPAFVPGLTTPV